MAHAVPIGGEATFAQIAEKAGVGETHMRRLLRLAMSQHIFHEPRPGVVAHTAASRLMAEDELVHQYMAWKANEGWLGAYHTCDAMAKWPDSGEPNETAFALGHGGKGMWEYMSAHPESLRRFADTMRLFARSPELDSHLVVHGYPWGELPVGATVVDVGGSHGAISCAIARAFPSLNFVVQVCLPVPTSPIPGAPFSWEDLQTDFDQDLDEPVIREAEKQRPADVADRVRYMVHDFLTEQPVRGADVYFLRAILHNWSDKYAVRILRNIIPALKPGSKIVINDVVIPEPDKVPKQQESALRGGVINMHVMFNSSDRELNEWARIFEEASPGFLFKGGKPSTPGSRLSILEAEWKGNPDR